MTDPENREADKKMLNEQILSKLEVTDGNRYEDFDKSTDKVSEHGLNALILGGARLSRSQKGWSSRGHPSIRLKSSELICGLRHFGIHQKEEKATNFIREEAEGLEVKKPKKMNR